MLTNGKEVVTLTIYVDGILHFCANRLVDPLPRYTPEIEGLPALADDVTIELSGEETLLLIKGGGLIVRMRLDKLAFGISLDGSVNIPRRSITLDPSQIIGFNGDKFGIGLRMSGDTPYYGFGEKSGLLNKNGQSMKFWNVDVCADHPDSCTKDNFDPGYASIPVAIWPALTGVDPWTKPEILVESVAYGAVLIDNNGPAWFNNNTKDFLEDNFFYFGSYSGQPSFYFITAKSMGEVCSQLSELTGKPKMPPVWALGNQQCRWGYDSESQVKKIVDQYEEYDIPLHGMWLDIDYMDRYRIFTWNHERIPSPENLTSWIHERNIKLVTIVDPGVAAVEGNGVYDEGHEKQFFCKTRSGKEFVAMVWPGKTVLPDYSLSEVRNWWGDNLANHILGCGVDGIWNDMNDPSTGTSDVDDMLFQNGDVEHQHYHNQYANLMAEATWEAMRRFDPITRPFILTRSAATGIQKHAALWTGDNASNWQHLRMSIPQMLNLSLSGVSFCGSDIGGFLLSPRAELFIRWYQAGILSPFFRNHSDTNTAHQEPWSYGTKVCNAVRNIIIQRYRLLGYLYTQFAEHIQTGKPMLRPMCYFSFDPIYRDVQDSYAVGDSIIVAPLLQEGASKRFVLLPPGDWYDLTLGNWHKGGVIFERVVPMDDVPVFIRKETIICEPIPITKSFLGWDCDLTKVRWRLHIFGSDKAAGSQYIDDGRTYVDTPGKSHDVVYADGTLTGSFPLELIDNLIFYDQQPDTDLTVDGCTFTGIGTKDFQVLGIKPYLDGAYCYQRIGG